MEERKRCVNWTFKRGVALLRVLAVSKTWEQGSEVCMRRKHLDSVDTLVSHVPLVLILIDLLIDLSC